MKPSFQQILSASAALKTSMSTDRALATLVDKAAGLLQQAQASGGTIYSCGNGGSACDAMHLTEELVARFRGDRPGIKAIHFGDAGVLSCWGNDKDFNGVYERCAETFCRKGDVLIAISTSGKSSNVIRAAQKAKSQGASVIGLLGKGGGPLAPICDVAVIVPSDVTERIQEAHITIIHYWCEFFER